MFNLNNEKISTHLVRSTDLQILISGVDSEGEF